MSADPAMPLQYESASNNNNKIFEVDSNTLTSRDRSGSNSSSSSSASLSDLHYGVSCDWNGKVHVFNSATGHTVKSHDFEMFINRVAVTNDNSMFAFAMYWQREVVVTSRSLDVLYNIKTPALCTCAAFDPSGSTVYVGDQDGNILAYDLHLQSVRVQRRCHNKGINNLTVSPDGTTLVCAARDKTASLLNMQTLATEMVFDEHFMDVSAAIILRDNVTVVTSSDDNTLRIWDRYSGKCLRTLAQHKDSVLALDYHPNADMIVSGSADKQVIVWSTQTFEPVHQFEAASRVLSVSFAFELDAVLVGVQNTGAVMFNYCKGDVVRTCASHQGWVRVKHFTAAASDMHLEGIQFIDIEPEIV